MKRKLITQEYFALATDANGNMPAMHREESNAGIVAAAVMDLLLSNVIQIERKRISLISDLPETLHPLSSLYAYLREKPRTTDKLMTDFYSGSRLKQLMAKLGEAMTDDGTATKGEGGFLIRKTVYIPDPEYRNELITAIKSAILVDDEITPHDTALIFILKETKNLNQYFSGYETETLRERLREMKKNPQNKQLAEMINYVNDMMVIIMACVLTSSS